MTEERSASKTSRKVPASRIVIVAVLAIAIATVIYFKETQTEATDESIPVAVSTQESSASAGALAESLQPKGALPRMIDLGADKCVPCKMMAPILEKLRLDYAGRFEVVFIDVWKKKSEAEKYSIKVIPTQIFFDASGQELFRHQGFFSREDILKTWQEHGFNFGPGNTAEDTS